MSKNVLTEFRVLPGIIAFRPEGRACSIYPLPELAPFKDDVAAFVAAGWSFAKSPDAPKEGQARVCVRGGRLQLDLGRMNVRFHTGVDADAAAILASRCGVELVRRLATPDVWAARIPPGGDLVAAIAKLGRQSDVDWIEPEFIEAIDRR